VPHGVGARPAPALAVVVITTVQPEEFATVQAGVRGITLPKNTPVLNKKFRLDTTSLI